jgi:uncharacterized membrane protein
MKKQHDYRGFVCFGLLVSILLVFVLMGCDSIGNFWKQGQEQNAGVGALFLQSLKEYWAPLLVYFVVSLVASIVLQKTIAADKKGKTIIIAAIGFILTVALVLIIGFQRIGGWKAIITS